MSKKKQVKKEVKKSKSCDCAAAIGILLGLLVSAAGTYYLCLPSRPEIGACYKHETGEGYAYVRDIDELDFVEYAYAFPYRTEDAEGRLSRSLEGFNERYTEKVDESSCSLATSLINEKQLVNSYKELLLKKAEK